MQPPCLEIRCISTKIYRLLLRLDLGEQLTIMMQDKNVEDTITIGFNSTDILEFENE